MVPRSLSAWALQSLHSTMRFHLKSIHTSFYDRTRLYTCQHSIYTVWCDYAALVSLAVSTIFFCICIYLIYIYICLFTYAFDLTYYYYYYYHHYIIIINIIIIIIIIIIFFLTLTLVRQMTWYELKFVFIMDFMRMIFFTILSTQNKAFNPIQSNFYIILFHYTAHLIKMILNHL